ncbi:hypothetical protein P7K49_018598, partial [Saguinus oedipus]
MEESIVDIPTQAERLQNSNRHYEFPEGQAREEGRETPGKRQDDTQAHASSPQQGKGRRPSAKGLLHLAAPALSPEA